MKKSTKELLFERMHTIGGMPLRENDDLIKNFYIKNNINSDDLSYLGSGDFGKAYSIDGKRVLKITNSKSECEIAQEILNGSAKYSSFADIYDVQNINNSCYIVMEELDTDSSIENLFYELQDILDSQGLPIQYLDNFDEDEYDGEISEELENFINGISGINFDYRRLGIEASDVRPENLGYDQKTGELKAFDIEDRQRS